MTTPPKPTPALLLPRWPRRRLPERDIDPVSTTATEIIAKTSKLEPDTDGKATFLDNLDRPWEVFMNADVGDRTAQLSAMRHAATRHLSIIEGGSDNGTGCFAFLDGSSILVGYPCVALAEDPEVEIAQVRAVC